MDVLRTDDARGQPFEPVSHLLAGKSEFCLPWTVHVDNLPVVFGDAQQFQRKHRVTAAPLHGGKGTGALAAADIEVFTRTTTFAIMQSLRLDKGPSGPVHP